MGVWVVLVALLAISCAGTPERTGSGAEPAPDPVTTPDDPSGPPPADTEVATEGAAGTEEATDLPTPDSSTDLLATMQATDPSGFAKGETADGLPNGVLPERVVIPAIGVDADVIELGSRDDGTMEVPTDFAQAGWFRHGPRPGRVGPALIAGHVDDRSGPAVFFRLAELSPGDLIEVHGQDGEVVTFAVREREQHRKDEFPTERVYAGTAGSELRLVTCGGAFDRDARSYRDNIIVYAERVDR